MPTEVPPRKDYKNTRVFKEPPFSDEDLRHLELRIDISLSAEAKNLLQEAGIKYLIFHQILDNPIRPSQTEAACKKIIKYGNKLTQTLTDLDSVSLERIAASHNRISAVDIIDIHERLINDLVIFNGATKTLQKKMEELDKEYPEPKGGPPKIRVALVDFVNDLISIFELVTGGNATSYYSEAHCSESLFFTFASDCIHAIQTEIIGDSAIAKAIQKALRSRLEL